MSFTIKRKKAYLFLLCCVILLVFISASNNYRSVPEVLEPEVLLKTESDESDLKLDSYNATIELNKRKMKLDYFCKSKNLKSGLQGLHY